METWHEIELTVDPPDWTMYRPGTIHTEHFQFSVVHRVYLIRTADQ